MSFSIKKVTDIDLDIKFLPKEKSKTKTRYEFLEFLKTSTISNLFDFEAESYVILRGPKFLKRLVEGPIIRLTKKSWYVFIGQDEISLTLNPELVEGLKEDNKLKITKKILQEGSEILGKVMLWLAGASKKTEIEITIDVEFTVDSRAENLNHMIDTKHIESASKIGCTISQQTGRYKFTTIEDEKEIEYGVLVVFPRIDDTWNRRTDRVIYDVKNIRIANLEDIDLNREVARISEIAKKTSVIIGA